VSSRKPIKKQQEDLRQEHDHGADARDHAGPPASCANLRRKEMSDQSAAALTPCLSRFIGICANEKMLWNMSA